MQGNNSFKKEEKLIELMRKNFQKFSGRKVSFWQMQRFYNICCLDGFHKGMMCQELFWPLCEKLWPGILNGFFLTKYKRRLL